MTYDEMNVSWSIWMSVQQLQNLASRSIEWDRIWRGSQTIERVLALLVCLELATKVLITLIVILLLIQAVRRCLPDVDHNTCQRLLGCGVHDCAMHECDFSVLRRVESDRATILSQRVVGSEEGS